MNITLFLLAVILLPALCTGKISSLENGPRKVGTFEEPENLASIAWKCSVSHKYATVYHGRDVLVSLFHISGYDILHVDVDLNAETLQQVQEAPCNQTFYPSLKKVYVSQYYSFLWRQIQETLKPWIGLLRTSRVPLVITGSFLGGGLAQLVALEFAFTHGLLVDSVILFDSTPMGNLQAHELLCSLTHCSRYFNLENELFIGFNKDTRFQWNKSQDILFDGSFMKNVSNLHEYYIETAPYTRQLQASTNHKDLLQKLNWVKKVQLQLLSKEPFKCL